MLTDINVHTVTADNNNVYILQMSIKNTTKSTEQDSMEDETSAQPEVMPHVTINETSLREVIIYIDCRNFFVCI